jgi:virginiamycin B lyase
MNGGGFPDSSFAALCAAAPASAQLIDEFSVPSGGRPLFIASGPDGMWFTEAENRIGRITPDGRVTEFAIRRPARRIVAGPDGNLWFTSDGFVSRMTPDGDLTDFPISLRGFGIVAGRDGNIWFTEIGNESYGRLGRSTINGEIVETPVAAWASHLAQDFEGNFWLPDWTEIGGDAMVRVAPSGTQSRFPIPGGLNAPGDVGLPT